MMDRRAVVLGVLALGVAMSACAGTTTSHQPSARSRVASYFAALDAHRWTDAEALVSPAVRRTDSTAPDSDRSNTLTVTRVRVRVAPAPFERGDYPGYTDIQQALVTFDATYRRVYGSVDGPQERFVYVGRRGAGAPWLILGIGTGP
jgi:hypothetical protein